MPSPPPPASAVWDCGVPGNRRHERDTLPRARLARVHLTSVVFSLHLLGNLDAHTHSQSPGQPDVRCIRRGIPRDPANRPRPGKPQVSPQVYKAGSIPSQECSWMTALRDASRNPGGVFGPATTSIPPCRAHGVPPAVRVQGVEEIVQMPDIHEKRSEHWEKSVRRGCTTTTDSYPKIKLHIDFTRASLSRAHEHRISCTGRWAGEGGRGDLSVVRATGTRTGTFRTEPRESGSGAGHLLRRVIERLSAWTRILRAPRQRWRPWGSLDRHG